MAAKTFPLTHEHTTALLELLRQVQAETNGHDLAPLTEAIDTVEGWHDWTEEPERVIFRKFKHDGAIIALFPDQLNERTGDIGSYMELGQHAETAPDFGDTVAAEEFEFLPLFRELQRQGYSNIKTVKRFGKLGRK